MRGTSGPAELGSASGTSPSGNGKPLPGSYETIAHTLPDLVPVSQTVLPASAANIADYALIS